MLPNALRPRLPAVGELLSEVASHAQVAADPTSPARFVVEDKECRITLATENARHGAGPDRRVIAVLFEGEAAPATECGVRVGDEASLVRKLQGESGELRGGRGVKQFRGALAVLLGERKAYVFEDGTFVAVSKGHVTGVGRTVPR